MDRDGTTKCDVAVVGGGPAGCATATYLAQAGFSVVIFDQTHRQDTSRTETLSPLVGRELARLGIKRGGMSEDFQAASGVLSVWGDHQTQILDSFQHIHREGTHVNREGFDRNLVENARARGVTVLSNCRFMSPPKRQGGHWKFEFSCQSDKAVCLCRFLVDATGRIGSSWLRPLSPRVPLDQLVAILWTGKSQLNSPYLMIESVEDGWFYSATSNREQTTIALVTDSDYCRNRSGLISDFWLRRLSQTTYIKERLPVIEDLRSLRIVSAVTVVRARTAGPGWCAVGDATFSHDPLSGLGVTHALGSAARAAVSIERHLRAGTSLREYETWIASRLRSYLLQRQETYALERRWRNSLFWQRRFVG